MIGKGLLFRRHPILAHLIPTRRCNLACGYCNEYDDTLRFSSGPVRIRQIIKYTDYKQFRAKTRITLAGEVDDPAPANENVPKP